MYKFLGILGTVFEQSKLNFGIVFEQFGLNFWDCFRIVWTGFSELFSGSSGLGSGLVLILGLMSSGFVMCFGIIVIR